MKLPKSYLTEGVVLVAISGAVYLAAYLYEIGYAVHFSIPREYITIDIRSLLLFGATTVFIAFAVYHIVNLAFLIHNTHGIGVEPSGYSLLVKKHVILNAVLLIVWLLSGQYLSELPRVAFWSALWLTADIVPPLFLREKGESFGSALLGWIQHSNDTKIPDLIGTMYSVKSRTAVFFAIAGFTTLGLAFMAGMGEARRKKEFPVDSEQRVMLRRYGDVIVFGYIGEEPKRLSSKIAKASVTEVAGPLEITEIGPFLETKSKKEKTANKAPEPTTTSVTPRAIESIFE